MRGSSVYKHNFHKPKTKSQMVINTYIRNKKFTPKNCEGTKMYTLGQVQPIISEEEEKHSSMHSGVIFNVHVAKRKKVVIALNLSQIVAFMVRNICHCISIFNKPAVQTGIHKKIYRKVCIYCFILQSNVAMVDLLAFNHVGFHSPERYLLILMLEYDYNIFACINQAFVLHCEF